MTKDSKVGSSIDESLAKQIEEELHAVLRRQINRSGPVPLPRKDFWSKISDLCNYLEVEVNRLGKAEGWSLRTQAAAKRQSSIRRASSELARKRLVSLLEHSTTKLFTANPFPGDTGKKSQGIESLDWGKHDSNERAFNTQVEELIRKFKHDIQWENIQFGVLGDFEGDAIKVASGTTQLDDFVKEDITEEGPPELLFIEPEEDLNFIDDFEDEEERIANAESFSDLSIEQEAHNLDSNGELIESESLMRIRIIKDGDEPFIDSKGNEFILSNGDIHQIDEVLANMLIQLDYAELAEL
ncbi:MAG: hypothetical protein VX277_01920 [Candidatus Thermoplasmatota archaeon]|nr:hypothetical protein [Candidatus Thermoplasmatota archaeon]